MPFHLGTGSEIGRVLADRWVFYLLVEVVRLGAAEIPSFQGIGILCILS